MTDRQTYMRDLRAAVADLLGERQQVSLAALRNDLPSAGFRHNLPGSTTLAKALVGLGWFRIPRPGSGAIYGRLPEQGATRG